MCWGVRAFPAGPLTLLLSDSLQAGLDKMSKGHMLADVVAIIGTRPTVSCVVWMPQPRAWTGRGQSLNFLFTG